jgi:hypothetical protein
MPLNEQFRLVLTESDKLLLTRLSQDDGESSMSATVRRLIRNEAKVRGLEAVSQQTEQAPSTL